MINGNKLGDVGFQKIGTPYSEMDCQAFVEWCIRQCGMNKDLAGSNVPVEQVVDRYIRMLTDLRDKGFQLYVLLNPPKVASNWLPDYTPHRQFGNARITAFVQALVPALEAGGFAWIDTRTPLSDENGCLPNSWSRDDFVHLNDTGAAALVDAVLEYLKAK